MFKGGSTPKPAPKPAPKPSGAGKRKSDDDPDGAKGTPKKQNTGKDKDGKNNDPKSKKNKADDDDAPASKKDHNDVESGFGKKNYKDVKSKYGDKGVKMAAKIKRNPIMALMVGVGVIGLVAFIPYLIKHKGNMGSAMWDFMTNLFPGGEAFFIGLLAIMFAFVAYKFSVKFGLIPKFKNWTKPSILGSKSQVSAPAQTGTSSSTSTSALIT